MRETRFIDQNKRKWAKFEKVLGSSKKDPEELSNLFIDITDDLSYSRTFYPNRSVRVYLNNIAQKVFYSVYKNRRSRLKRFAKFWIDDIPQVIYESRGAFLTSLFIFLGSVLIGVFSTYMDPEFPRVILGDEYVEMTYRNIERGRPMAVYQQAGEFDMFLHISMNNLFVSFRTFILGLFFGIGSIYILVYNGIMVGAFQALFIREGVYMDSILTIWLHGTIEISCIIIAGAAGLTLGRGLVFPGTYTRLQSLQLSARRGLLIMLTITPLIILAAVIESFFTRYAAGGYVWIFGAVKMPFKPVAFVLVGLSLAFVVFYFIIYPIVRARRGVISFERDVNLPPSQPTNIDFRKIKNVGQIFSDTFTHYRKHIKSISVLAGLVTIAYTTTLMVQNFQFNFSTSWGIGDIFDKAFFNIEQFLFLDLSDGKARMLWMLNYGATSVMLFWVLHTIQREANKARGVEKGGVWYYVNTISATLVVTGILQFVLTLPGGFVFLALIFVFPLLALWMATVFNERKNMFTGIGKMFSVLPGNWVSMMGGYLAVLLMCIVFLFLTTAPILTLYFDILASALPISDSMMPRVHQGFFTSIHAFMMSLLFPLMFAIVAVGYHSFRETRLATDLFEQIPEIGVRKKSFGMERES